MDIKIKVFLAVLLAALIVLSVRTIDYTKDNIKQPNVTRRRVMIYDSLVQTDVSVEERAEAEAPTEGWWLGSGGQFRFTNGEGETDQGSQLQSDKWTRMYQAANAKDTDNGIHPQNIFRLVYLAKIDNMEQESCFLVNRDNLSQSENRNQSNGFLLFNRYIDENNLYYTGLRVDGSLVIKKKKAGKYTTISTIKVLDGVYDREANPSLIPKNQWIGIKSSVIDEEGVTKISLSYDLDCSGNWSEPLLGEDKEDTIRGKGSGGIRGDFMDLKFKNYRLSRIL